MKNTVLTFCSEFEFPDEATVAMSAAYDALVKEEAAFTKFNQYVELYFADKLEDYSEALAALDKAAGQCGIHRYTLHLLFYICLSEHTAEQYKKRNLPAAIYHDSIMDLKWTLLECHKIHGIWGTFVADWVAGFFRLTRFTLGRLQFELTRYDGRYTRYGHQLAPEDIAVDVHIPSSGPLRHEDCLNSYQRAAEFFRDSFTGRPIAFVCHSWLLFPPNREILPETSNIIRFMADYDVTAVEENDGEDLWRIFDKEYNGNPDDLPDGTSLQRAYIRWLKAGNRPGAGRGVLFWEGSE